jgi:hypothetical protein
VALDARDGASAREPAGGCAAPAGTAAASTLAPAIVATGVSAVSGSITFSTRA